MRTVLVLALLLAGCGGSSSETPPPLEPDPTSYRYSGPRMPRASDAVAAAAEPELEAEPSVAAAKSSARETWGDGTPAQPPPASSTQGIEFQ
ncbi:MAG TPA: hypothetical protein VIW29_02825 [Polyangiaceae bacterium]